MPPPGRDQTSGESRESTMGRQVDLSRSTGSVSGPRERPFGKSILAGDGGSALTLYRSCFA
jgi:hypothetical protein